MKKPVIKNIAVLLVCLFISVFTIPAYSISAAVKSQQDYAYILSVIKTMDIIVSNFPDNMIPDEEGAEKEEGNNEIRNQYDEIRVKFQRAGETYFSRDYADAYNQFRSLKFELIDLLELISLNYKARTKEILDSLSTDVFDILVEYGKGSPKTHFFRLSFDPMYDQKPYNEKNHHLFYNRETIATYLKDGYARYRDAQDQFNDPEIQYIINKRNISSKSLNYVVERYLNTITFCREAKQLGIEIYKIGITRYDLPERAAKPDRPEVIHSNNVKPVLDERIPEEFKVDANDNLNLIHSEEVRSNQQ